MTTKPLTLVATVKAKPGKESQLRDVLQSLLAPTRREDGCLYYDLHRTHDNPAQFVFLESWISRAHLDAHLKTPHLQAFLGQANDLLAEPVQLMFLEKMD